MKMNDFIRIAEEWGHQAFPHPSPDIPGGVAIMGPLGEDGELALPNYGIMRRTLRQLTPETAVALFSMRASILNAGCSCG